MAANLGIDREDIVAAITGFIAASGYPPSVRELCDIFDCNVSTMHHHLTRLRQSGRVQWRPLSSRTLVVIDE